MATDERAADEVNTGEHDGAPWRTLEYFATTRVIVASALVLAAKAGVDPGKVFDAIKGGLAGSTVLNAKAPMVLKGNYKPGFRIELHIKDLQNALDTAHAIGVPIPLTGTVMEIMQALRVDGKQKDDHGGVIQFYEKLAGQLVRSNL